MKKTFIMVMCAVVALCATAQDRLYINDFVITASESKQVEIMLDNAIAYTALQADIVMPDGLTIEQEEGDYIFDLTERKSNNHTLASTTLPNGTIRIMITSQSLKVINGNSGPLIKFNVIADASLEGTHEIEITNVIAIEPNRTEHRLTDTHCTVMESAMLANYLYIEDFDIARGATKQVEIMLNNDVAFTALQADIFMPEGLTIEQQDGDFVFSLTDRKGRDHTATGSLLANGAVRLLVASQTLKEINGNSGALVTFNAVASNDFTGPKKIEIKNVIASEVDHTGHNLLESSCTVQQEQSCVPGDVNGDGECTGSDVTALYNFILYNDSSAIVNGDQNGDGEVTGSDVTAVYNIILGL